MLISSPFSLLLTLIQLNRPSLIYSILDLIIFDSISHHYQHEKNLQLLSLNLHSKRKEIVLLVLLILIFILLLLSNRTFLRLLNFLDLHLLRKKDLKHCSLKLQSKVELKLDRSDSIDSLQVIKTMRLIVQIVR